VRCRLDFSRTVFFTFIFSVAAQFGDG